MEWTREKLLEQQKQWRRSLQEQDRSPGTIEKYVEAVVRFLAWYEQEEGAPLQLKEQDRAHKSNSRWLTYSDLVDLNVRVCA